MFRCALTNRQSSPGDKPVSLVVLRRRRTYDKRVYDLETRTVDLIRNASHGWEIVKELTVCASAAKEWIAAHPEGAEWVSPPLQVEE